MFPSYKRKKNYHEIKLNITHNDSISNLIENLNLKICIINSLLRGSWVI